MIFVKNSGSYVWARKNLDDMRELKMGNPGYERIFIDDRPRFVTDLCFEIEGFEIQKTLLPSEGGFFTMMFVVNR